MAELVSPYAEEGPWLRGNLHAHSANSDGVRTPERVIDDYAARGHDFLAISDHDVFTDPAKHQTEAGIMLLTAVEVSAGGPHMIHVGATDAVQSYENRQEVVDAIRDDAGFAVPAHPNWGETFTHWSRDELNNIEGYAGIEIYNGHIEHLPGAASATSRWDQLLSEGRQAWGFANDDSHHPWEVDRGWNVVQVDERTPGAILDALASGRFYASTGVKVQCIDVSGEELTIETANADRIRLISDHGVVQQTVAGPIATFRIHDQLVHGDEHSYARVECIGEGGERAWLQPMFLE